MLLKASLPMIKDTVADYLLSGTIETNNKIEYFLTGPNNTMWMTKEQVSISQDKSKRNLKMQLWA